MRYTDSDGGDPRAPARGALKGSHTPVKREGKGRPRPPEALAPISAAAMEYRRPQTTRSIRESRRETHTGTEGLPKRTSRKLSPAIKRASSAGECRARPLGVEAPTMPARQGRQTGESIVSPIETGSR